MDTSTRFQDARRQWVLTSFSLHTLGMAGNIPSPVRRYVSRTLPVLPDSLIRNNIESEVARRKTYGPGTFATLPTGLIFDGAFSKAQLTRYSMQSVLQLVDVSRLTV